MLFELAEDFLADVDSAARFVEARNVQHSEPDFLVGDFEGSTFIEVDLGGDFLDAVGYFDGGVAGQEFGSGAFARARAADNENIEDPVLCHF